MPYLNFALCYFRMKKNFFFHGEFNAGFGIKRTNQQTNQKQNQTDVQVLMSKMKDAVL